MANTSERNATVTHKYECSSYISTVTEIFAWHVFFVGLTTNLVFLYLVLKKLASGLRSDKLFLVNIVAANILSMLGSLPGEALGRGNTMPHAKTYCIFYHAANFISLFNNLTSMAALCYNMYENVIKYPGNRLLTLALSLKIVVGSWVLSLVLVPTAQSGFLVADTKGFGMCKVGNNKVPLVEEIVSFFSLIVVVSIWITVTSVIMIKSLTGITSKLNEHISRTEQVLHNASRIKAISFKKQTLVMVSCYSISWIPFGVAALLTAIDFISFHSCVYFICLVVAHVSAATTPIIYLTIDKRFKVKCCGNTRQKTPRQVGAN
ncbi:uncharacterized protein LOC114531964 [Dendronephthya gigantea]|uniref:uncharacterized protein LOC114531964 n=1 Tax=Dendronephthya gigantea TaxID=151771 RepID=UPI0010693F09|nr:uncharacterized protein LOC114531964 [Dendronephthya gigantea]